MNPLIELKKTAPLLLMTLTLHCFALLPQAQAVVPPPDGGYPGQNTAEGDFALLSLTTGAENTAVGYAALAGNTTGTFNTANGFGALVSNTTGSSNAATGDTALFGNTTGNNNTANGVGALFSNSTGNNNTANGVSALASNSTGNDNTANGVSALFSNTTGYNNTANGVGALALNTTGRLNTANGDSALASNTTGSLNTANGSRALLRNTTGNNNTADGYGALGFNTTGIQNTANGDSALASNTTGSGNIALGLEAGHNVTTANSVICIGARGADVSNSCYIAQIFGATSSGGTGVFINADGKLGTIMSSQRFKKEIKPMDRASEALFALKPVSFRYKTEIDPAGTSQLGLVAEDVEKVNRDLVVRDKEGKPYSVRYDQVNAMLLNEFLKEHRTLEKLEAALRAVNQRLAEQDEKIQKVTADLQLSRQAPQTVSNER